MANYTNYTKKELFLKAYRAKMCNISRACEGINMTRRTYYNWLNKFPKFKEQVEEVKESLNDMVEAKLINNIEKGNQKAIEFWLTNNKKDKYNNRKELEFTMPKVIRVKTFIQAGEPPVIKDEPDPEEDKPKK